MKIVGISACPAGLAHTPMAAKALEKAGKSLGYDVKMEQQGSMGQVNTITDEEAQAADLVIIASDQKIPARKVPGTHNIIIQTIVSNFTVSIFIPLTHYNELFCFA